MDPIAAGYTNPVTGKPLSGAALLLKVASGESGFDSSADSGKAKGRTQFTPGSRQVAIDKYGVDPLRSVDEAYHAAALHLQGKINGSKGLEGYNPGMASYPDYILGQKIGPVGGGGGSSGSVSAPASAPGGGEAASGAPPQPGSTAGVEALLAAIKPQQQPRQMAGLAAPAFSAAPTLAAGAQVPSGGGGGPQRSSQVSALLEAAAVTGQQPEAASSGGPEAPRAPGAPRGATAETYSAGYPTAKPGKIIGTPHAGTHTLGDWQSDNAVDIGVPVGTPMVALDGGVVVKVRKHPQGAGRFAGDQITIRGADGNSYFYAHGTSTVKAGEKVKAGEQIGTTGSANGVAHLHFGVEKGDPRKLIGQGR